MYKVKTNWAPSERIWLRGNITKLHGLWLAHCSLLGFPTLAQDNYDWNSRWPVIVPQTLPVHNYGCDRQVECGGDINEGVAKAATIQSWSLQRVVPSWPRLTALSSSKAGKDAWRRWVFHQLVFSAISFCTNISYVPICPNISPLECYIVQSPCNLVTFSPSQILSLGKSFVFTLHVYAAIGWSKRCFNMWKDYWGTRTIKHLFVHIMSFSFVDHSLEWAWK